MSKNYLEALYALKSYFIVFKEIYLGEFPIPTVPTVTVYDTWPNNTWFWIWHALGVVIIIALIISIIVLCLKMRKRKQYERLT